jgi:hypothetical protein
MKNGILGLFALLVIILMVNPRIFFNLYNNILGRVVLIGVVLFLTTFNVTLGLLGALCLIIASNMFFMEGLDNMTIGDDNAVSTEDAKIKVTTGGKTKETAKEKEPVGVDLQRVHETIQPKNSKSIPVDKTNFKSDDVSPNESESQVVEGLMNKYARV